jgi:hypothetical protein
MNRISRERWQVLILSILFIHVQFLFRKEARMVRDEYWEQEVW